MECQDASTLNFKNAQIQICKIFSKYDFDKYIFFLFVLCITNKIKMAYRTRKHGRKHGRRGGRTRRCRRGGVIDGAYYRPTFN